MKIVKRAFISILASALFGLFINIGVSWPQTPEKKPGPEKRVIKLVCSDQLWYPFVYMEKDVEGIHVDIVRAALENAGYSASIEALPLARCIKMAERGMVDGIISVAYDKNYARFIEYPPGSAEAKESQWRIMQVDDVVVTSSEDDYEFAGDISTLPRPVHVFKSEPILEELKETGVETEPADTNWLNFSKLARRRQGSIITTSVIAEKMGQDESFRGKFTIQVLPLRSRSYYLAFSWGAHLTHDERMRIWKEIENVREDNVFMLTTFGKY